MTRKLVFILACCMLATSACNLVYKQNVQQGNAIEQDKLDQLEIGMTKTQVAFLLGTPAIRDPFHHDRWDYFYSFAIRGRDPTSRLITLRFENAQLKSMSGIDFDNPDKVITATDEAETTEEAEAGSENVVEATPAEMSTATASATDSPTEQSVVAVMELPEVERVTIETTDGTEQAAPVETQAQTDSGPVQPFPPDAGLWGIQIGAFDRLEYATQLVAKAKMAGFDVSILNVESANTGSRYLVRSSGYESRIQADRQLEMINSALDIGGFLIPPSKE